MDLRWYLENIQDQYIHESLQDETIGIVTQFQQDNNNEILIADLHIFNQFRMPDTFTIDIKQCLQRKVKYAYEFGKMKKALNLALDLDCEDVIFNMINGFINCKKNTIEETNNENKKENLQILDPIVQKQCGRPPNKWLLNQTHVMLAQKIAQLIHLILIYIDFGMQRHEANENTLKQKVYLCKICEQSDHNARTCNK
ncbi:unnamed protein product [Rhizophagus irregularis]|nr:unnamed protein product [Rhizophagus irregularis]